MSEHLSKLLNMVRIKEGRRGLMRLALEIDRSERTITLYMKGSHSPDPSTAYKLAKACSASEEDALQIANECAPHKGKSSA